MKLRRLQDCLSILGPSLRLNRGAATQQVALSGQPICSRATHSHFLSGARAPRTAHCVELQPLLPPARRHSAPCGLQVLQQDASVLFVGHKADTYRSRGTFAGPAGIRTPALR